MNPALVGKLIYLAILFAALGSGLVAGIFFAFSNFVMPALAQLPANKGMPAMQRINVTVLNPLFLGVFAGTAVLSLLLMALALMNSPFPPGKWLLAGGLLYVLGCFMVTGIFNVPLNNALAASDAGTAAGETLWHNYVISWTRWNHVRTMASLAACGCFIHALWLLRDLAVRGM